MQVIAHPEGFRIVLTDCDEVARDTAGPHGSRRANKERITSAAFYLSDPATGFLVRRDLLTSRLFACLTLLCNL